MCPGRKIWWLSDRLARLVVLLCFQSFCSANLTNCCLWSLKFYMQTRECYQSTHLTLSKDSKWAFLPFLQCEKKLTGMTVQRLAQLQFDCRDAICGTIIQTGHIIYTHFYIQNIYNMTSDEFLTLPLVLSKWFTLVVLVWTTCSLHICKTCPLAFFH